MNNERMLALADHIENVVTDKKFNMDLYGVYFCDVIEDEVRLGKCGTSGCIAGWAIALFPEEAKKIAIRLDELSGEDEKGSANIAQKILGLTEIQAGDLFLPHEWGGQNNWETIPRARAVDKLRSMVKVKKATVASRKVKK